MATVKLLSDDELSPEARVIFDDIRRTRQSDFVNNFWRALAHDPKTLARTNNIPIPCSKYEENGYKPAFDELPLEADYWAAQEKVQSSQAKNTITVIR
jgi:hypothetical protein